MRESSFFTKNMVKQLSDFYSDMEDDELRQFASDFYIPYAVHPVLPAENAYITDFPQGKIGVYTRFFEWANQRVPYLYFFVISYVSIGFTFPNCTV